MQNREPFQTLNILFYSVFRIMVNCGITIVNLNWKAFLINYACFWFILDYRIHRTGEISIQVSLHPSIRHPSIHPSNKHLPKPYCICAIAWKEHSGWGHSSSLQNVTVYLRTFIYTTHSDTLNCSKCYTGVGKWR